MKYILQPYSKLSQRRPSLYLTSIINLLPLVQQGIAYSIDHHRGLIRTLDHRMYNRNQNQRKSDIPCYIPCIYFQLGISLSGISARTCRRHSDSQIHIPSTAQQTSTLDSQGHMVDIETGTNNNQRGTSLCISLRKPRDCQNKSSKIVYCHPYSQSKEECKRVMAQDLSLCFPSIARGSNLHRW